MSAQDAIQLVCSHCNRNFRVRSVAAGRSVKCPGCSKPVSVPATASNPPALPSFMSGNLQSAAAEPTDPFSDLDSLPMKDVPRPKPWDDLAATSPYQPPASTPLNTAASAIQIRTSNFSPRQYPALQTIRTILRGLAFISLAICGILLLAAVVIFLVSLIGGGDKSSGAILGGGLVGSLVSSLPLLFSALLLFSYAELIAVFLDVQRNTQESAYHLRLKS